jgi:hypothetical protein
MSDNHWLKALHAERLKRHIGDGAVAAATSGARSPSSPSSTPTLKPEGNKRKVEVIDLIDDEDKKESRQEKKKREQEEADSAFARRLAAEENPQAPQLGSVARRAPEEHVVNNEIDDGFDKLASIVLFQLISRHDASNALETLLKADAGCRD